MKIGDPLFSSGVGYRPSCRRPLFWFVCIITAAMPPRRALALDPARRLTQALHRIWQVQQGLPEATIHCIRQTTDGYVWLGTRTGLVRFDGVQFTTISALNAGSPAGAWVRDLAEDAEHDLWIATETSGLMRLRGRKVDHFGFNDGLPSDSIQCLLVDGQNRLWIGTSSGLATWQQGKFTKVATPDLAGGVRSLCLGKEGAIWIGGDSNVLIVGEGSRFWPRPLTSVPSRTSVRGLLVDPQGTLWAATSAGLVRVAKDQEKRLTSRDGLGDDWTDCLAAGRDGTIWVGARDGFSRIRQDQIETFRASDGLSQSTVFALCEDREGSLWVGTKHGLNQFLDRRLTMPFTTSEGLPSNNAGPVLQDFRGQMWVGTLDAGLARFDGKTFSVITAAQGLAGPSIQALAEDAVGDLWAGAAKGLNRLHDGKVARTFTTADGLPSDSIRCLLCDRQGRVWAGTTAGLALLNDGRFGATADSAVKGASIVAMTQLQDGRMMVSTTGGGLFFRSLDGQWRTFFAADGSRRALDCFFEDKDGLSWIGTVGDGVYLLRGDGLVRYGTNSGLFDDDVYGIQPDDHDRLWMACSKGIFSVNRSDLRQFADGRIKRYVSTPFSPTDAQRTIECRPGVQPGLCGLRDGRLWFSTIHGVIVIDPRQLQHRPATPPALIEDVIVNGRPEPPERLASLPPGRENIQFRYTDVSFLYPSRMTFRYKLEGFDKDWIEAGPRREAFYTNLPPGEFRFLVSAAVLDGPYGPPTQITLTLRPHWYQQRWFWPACGVCLLLAVWLGIRLRIRAIKSHMALILTERSRIARELHDTLIQGFSGVTMEMQALSATLREESPRRMLQDIIRDAGQCLREARRSVAGLRNDASSTGVSDLPASIEQAARHLAEARDIRLRLDLPPLPALLGPEREYNLLRIAQEAVNNAIKHAVARTIDVSLGRKGTDLQLLVHDDGVGFEAGNGIGAGHYGLIGMKERAAQAGGRLIVDSGPGRGTTVSVIVPLNADVAGRRGN